MPVARDFSHKSSYLGVMDNQSAILMLARDSDTWQTKTDLERLQVRMVTTMLSTILTGIYSLCAAYATQILFRRGLTGPRRRLLYIIVAMYLATFISWMLLVIGQFQTFHALKNYLTVQYPSFPPLPSILPDCGGTMALTLNVMFGDGIVWWRVWVLWNKKRWILVPSCIILLATLGTGVLDSVDSCGGSLGSSLFQRGQFFQLDIFGLCTISLSLLSNTVAPLLVGYKAWEHRRALTKTQVTRLQRTTQVHRILMLLIESGIVYWLIWILVLLSQLLGLFYTTFFNYMEYFIEGCLTAFVGIYPTLIIILVALDKSEIEKESMEHSTLSAVREIHPRDVTMELVSRADTTCSARLSEVVSDSSSEWTTIQTKSDA